MCAAVADLRTCRDISYKRSGVPFASSIADHTFVAVMTGGDRRAQRASILLVEDEEELRDIVGDLLEEDGYDVIPAGNGKQALDFLRNARELPSVIVLDLMMPIVSGWECLREIQGEARFASIPVLVVTAISRDRPHGVTALLKKPFSVADLLESVRRLSASGRDGVASPGAHHL
jgi:CheY-like chemotaxis protein